MILFIYLFFLFHVKQKFRFQLVVKCDFPPNKCREMIVKRELSVDEISSQLQRVWTNSSLENRARNNFSC